MQQGMMEELWKTAHLSGGNAPYIEELFETYLADPNTVPEQWRNYFDALPKVDGVVIPDVSHATVRDQFLQFSRQATAVAADKHSAGFQHEFKQIRVLQLIDAYRNRGHQKASLDPLDLQARPAVPDLELTYHGLSTADLDGTFKTGSDTLLSGEGSLREIIECLEQTYCGSIGAEYMHIVDSEETLWVRQRMESVRSRPAYGVEIKKQLLERLGAAEGLEKSLGSKYPGTKRFGLEGGESLIPMLDELIQRTGSYGVKEIVIGMAHRGRLNVLVNILGKNPSELFDEFEGGHMTEEGSGDVKYHQGFSSNLMSPGGEIHLALAFNPSHLEISAPVVVGSVRARQDRRMDPEGDQVMAINIHGDAAVAGQGVVMETLQMSQIRGFKTGGTVHIVINNQVGFTISRQDDARSTEYCTDIAKMVQAPIFHVNGDDPEAVLFVTQLAADYRRTFKKDVFIDMICYRRRGHNEADEPSGTQPMMYQKIKAHPTTFSLYSADLIEKGVISAQQRDQLVNEYRDNLDQGKHVVKSLITEPIMKAMVDWTPYLGHDYWGVTVDTSVDSKVLQKLAGQLNTIPDGIVLQAQVSKIIGDRIKMAAGALPINWGFAETLAYATLVTEGTRVRLIGQDVGRGTFSHRHAVLHNQKNGEAYTPLDELGEDAAPFDLYDSFLSEEAVLAFEYGYATTTPNALVIWEAQFGDFANGAQVVIDQFITSGEDKWGRVCGLTMLLPHGYEGQGPEHSSARLERFLQLCAEKNIQVCVPTTPAQIFHLLRQQVIRPLRKPLIIMSPKSLLRHKQAISTLEDLSDGSFQPVIADALELSEADKVKRVVLCSGKVYYDLIDKRRSKEQDNVAIMRVEQLYPFPLIELRTLMQQYPNLEDVVWCQEEPMNQGAWYSSQHHMHKIVEQLDTATHLTYAGRAASAAPAAGYLSIHVEQQNRLVSEALDIE
ncbi:MAG: 2-oxoglutarate dehydrogenase E1 component [Pseudomonadales bacterium]|nr:2-oxoglutarate dehydrogenase E1 component [Pseudomonadales bacterium]